MMITLHMWLALVSLVYVSFETFLAFVSTFTSAASSPTSLVSIALCFEVLVILKQFHGWMDERCFRPLLCTVKAELGRGQPGLMR